MELDVKDEPIHAAAPAKCATCEVLQQVPFACQDCHELLAHVQGADYFELFGVSRSYRIDLAELNRKYLTISRNIHPDRFSNSGDEMQSFSLRMSAAVNRAHDVLRDPLLRAEYLLECAGGPSAAQDKRVPDDLLGQVLLVREEIEDANSSGDSAALDRIRKTVTNQRDEVEAHIAHLSESLERTGQTAFSDLRQQLNAMKYLNNLLMQL